MFSCELGLYDRNSKKCIFRNVSACMGFVAGSEICNRHLAPFNLKLVHSHYCDANNERFSRPNLYMTGNLNVPLFRTPEGTVDTVAINTFAESAKDKDSQINEVELANAIACAMGISAIQPEKTNSWLEDTPVYVIDQNNEYSQLILPYLHRIIFKFALPAFISRVGPEYIMLDPNVVLTHNPYFVGTDAFKFKVTKKSKTFVYTDEENCVASPLVLEAFYNNTQERAVQCFSTKPRISNFGMI